VTGRWPGAPGRDAPATQWGMARESADEAETTGRGRRKRPAVHAAVQPETIRTGGIRLEENQIARRAQSLRRWRPCGGTVRSFGAVADEKSRFCETSAKCLADRDLRAIVAGCQGLRRPRTASVAPGGCTKRHKTAPFRHKTARNSTCSCTQWHRKDPATAGSSMRAACRAEASSRRPLSLPWRPLLGQGSLA
jgi:hypothetical protein